MNFGLAGLSFSWHIGVLAHIPFMLRALTLLLAFQATGELITFTLTPGIPGPVWGLILLLGYFFIRKGVPNDVAQVAGVFTGNLGLLFVPAAVGVVVFWPLLATHGLVILLSLFISVVMVLGVTAWVVDRLASRLKIGPAATGEALTGSVKFQGEHNHE